MTESPALPQSHETAEIFTARSVALSLLCDVLDRKMALDLALERHKGFLNLPARDRAFVRMLVSTVLRRRGEIDFFISQATDGRDPVNPPALMHLLRMGATQIAFMSVPDYAVVDSAVRLAEEENLGRQKGFVNAVLRRIAAEFKNWRDKVDPVTANIPDWLLKSWIADYGLKDAADIARASLTEAPLDISVKNPEELSYWEGTLKAMRLASGSLRIHEGGDVRKLIGFDDGMWWVQDAAAALPALLLGDVSGRHVVDFCAAPGGKTAQLAAQGASVTAIDRSTQRLKRLQENMNRLRLEQNVRTEVADAAAWTTKEQPELILLDAPCSATGTIRRHPDLLHLKAAKDVEKLKDAQAKILHHACDLLAPGGLLVYCTCSLQKAEGEYQVDALLNARQDIGRVPVKPEEIGGMDALISAEGDLRIMPYHLATQGGMDGFYAARLQKITQKTA